MSHHDDGILPVLDKNEPDNVESEAKDEWHEREARATSRAPPGGVAAKAGGSAADGALQATPAPSTAKIREKEMLKARMAALSSELSKLREVSAPPTSSSNNAAPSSSARISNDSPSKPTAPPVAASLADSRQRDAAAAAVKALLASVAPTAPVAAVGSVASGLALCASDVDIVVCMANLRSAAKTPSSLRDHKPDDDPLLVLLLCGQYLGSVRMRKQGKKQKQKGLPPGRNKADLKAALESTLAEFDFAQPKWKRGSPLLRMVHVGESAGDVASGVTVDVWMDETAVTAAASEAARRAEATRAAVTCAPGGAVLAALHRVLRAAVGRELRGFEGYAGEPGGASLGSYVTLLLVRRFLAREGVVGTARQRDPQATWETLLEPLLTSLAFETVRDEDAIVALDDLLPGAPPIKVYPGRGTRLLRMLCQALLGRLQSGAALGPLLHSRETEGGEERAALVRDVFANMNSETMGKKPCSIQQGNKRAKVE